eukprot:m.203758 g.203758  ORF g.203758 m.203758 type:complete len:62 (+) comp18859_c0_seq1:1311-1496(+)
MHRALKQAQPVAGLKSTLVTALLLYRAYSPSVSFHTLAFDCVAALATVALSMVAAYVEKRK